MSKPGSRLSPFRRKFRGLLHQSFASQLQSAPESEVKVSESWGAGEGILERGVSQNITCRRCFTLRLMRMTATIDVREWVERLPAEGHIIRVLDEVMRQLEEGLESGSPTSLPVCSPVSKSSKRICLVPTSLSLPSSEQGKYLLGEV